MNNTIYNEMIQLKIREIAKMLNPYVPFVASHGWLQKFKKRDGIRQLKICGEKLSANDFLRIFEGSSRFF
jgi:hypothetical protein